MHFPDHLIAAIYTTARQEIIERIKLRDQLVAGYVVFASVVLGLAVKDNASVSAIALPYVAFAAACLSRQHQQVIGGIARFLAAEFERDLRDVESTVSSTSSIAKPSVPITQWDRSRSMLSLGHLPFERIGIVHYAIFVLPSFVALFITRPSWIWSDWAFLMAWLISAFFAIGTIYQIKKATEDRKELRHDQFRAIAHRLGYPAREQDLAEYFQHFQSSTGTWPDQPK